ncbi:type I-E CRISPR-associated protein Cse1/CasA [Pseudochrobactrum sp. HB0163]|uniref:type I-E CRISPR-associated protein Cse1/CasA n=1 Tax=Pseudochrobactrum sp. HB0163 TaxID=3450708 RepID=UPI003F6DE905
MSLNLINDAWIPVICAGGERRIIAPWQMAEPDIIEPDWPRPDLNIACYELLIGLVYLADPPANNSDWDAREKGDPERLRARLAPFAPAFNLIGEGALFLQDPALLAGEPNPVDMLFIDSAGAQTARNNADLMVHRARYNQLDLPLAAMALYTFQAFAPSGGAGNRTSMRGGGPMVTLADPGGGLWDIVWANVPAGLPGQMSDLPWMRPVRTSEKGEQVMPEGHVFGAEAFFGMPRRLRLVGNNAAVTGVIQKPYGINYAGWKHPLSPYYRLKVGTEWLPKHPRAGRFSYRNWLGIVCEDRVDEAGVLTELSASLREWRQRVGGGSLLVAGWAMDNMKPRDFILSRQPLIDLPAETSSRLVGLIEAAEHAALVLRNALSTVLAEGEVREAEREEFYRATEARFFDHVRSLQAGGEPETVWLAELRAQALAQFDAQAQPLLYQREIGVVEKIVNARKFLNMAFAGYSKQGKLIFEALGMPVPVVKKRKAA